MKRLDGSKIRELHADPIQWTRLSCRSFAAKAMRLPLHALVYNLGNFLRTLPTPYPYATVSMMGVVTPIAQQTLDIAAALMRF
jgi:hypothetical protein